MKFIKNHLFVFSLVILMIMDTFLEEVSHGMLISLIFLSVTAGLCMYVLSEQRKIFWTMMIASVVIIGFDYVTLIFVSQPMQAAQYLSLTLLFITYAILLFIIIINKKNISISDISNAISVYLLIGIAFGFLYSFIEIIHPGAITYNKPESADISGDMIYFSFVTLTTVGFGDILPVYKIAKVIVMIESVLGVLYIAIMIGRLVGISPKKANTE